MPKYINPYKLFTGSFIPNWLLERPEVSDGAKIVYARLSQHANRQTGAAYPKRETLAREISKSVRQTDRLIAELLEHGLIETKQVGFGKPNQYYFLRHLWIDAADDSEPDIPDSPRVDILDRSEVVKHGDSTEKMSEKMPEKIEPPRTVDHQGLSGDQVFQESRKGRVYLTDSPRDIADIVEGGAQSLMGGPEDEPTDDPYAHIRPRRSIAELLSEGVSGLVFDEPMEEDDNPHAHMRAPPGGGVQPWVVRQIEAAYDKRAVRLALARDPDHYVWLAALKILDRGDKPASVRDLMARARQEAE